MMFTLLSRSSRLKNATFLRRWRLLSVVSLLALVAASCVAIPLEKSWAQLSLIGTPEQILFTYNNLMTVVDPVDGTIARLRDAEGQVRVDEQGSPRTWQLEGASSPATFYSSPVRLDDDVMLAAAYETRLFRVDMRAARILNPEGIPLSGQVVTDLLIQDGLLFVPYNGGALQARSVSDPSQVLWTFNAERGIWSPPLLLNDGTLIVPSMDHFLYALDADTGEEVWRLNLNGAIGGTPVLYEDHLYVGSFARKIFKITLDGQIVAEYETNDWIWGAPTIHDGVLYTADMAGYVYALNLDDGFDVLWSRRIAERGIRPSPLVTDDVVIVGGRDRRVYWLSRATGEELIRREMAGEVLSELMLLEPSETINIRVPLVIVSTIARNELLVAFTLDNGERRWVYGS